jgi:hypothetical protein
MPSMSTWPSANSATKVRSITFSWPTTALLTSRATRTAHSDPACELALRCSASAGAAPLPYSIPFGTTPSIVS